MQRRGWIGLLSVLVAVAAGCTSTTGAQQMGDEVEDADSGRALTLKFVDASLGLVVSCEDCPGLASDERFEPGEFPSLELPPGTRVTLKLSAPGFISQTREVALESESTVVSASLEPL